MHLTIKERVELVLMSGADGATNRSVAKKFNRIYPDREPISHTTIGRLILKFRGTGSVLDKPKSGYSRVSDETRRRVIEKVESSPAACTCFSVHLLSFVLIKTFVIII